MRILLVDDEPAIRFAVARFCARAGASITVVEAGDANTAMEALRQREFDAVLLDRRFPGGGDAAVLAAMAATGPLPGPGHPPGARLSTADLELAPNSLKIGAQWAKSFAQPMSVGKHHSGLAGPNRAR